MTALSQIQSHQVASLVESFRNSGPVRHLVLDDFLDPTWADALFAEFPDTSAMPKSRDYVFSDKRELSTVDSHSPSSRALHEVFVGDDFRDLITLLLGKPVFIDPEYIGGGFHAGNSESFLDLHTDFNIHPAQPLWRRELNILLYLNPGWEPSWEGELRLTSTPTQAGILVTPIHNRLVVMESNEASFHGYDRIRFPTGRARLSIAAYGYSLLDSEHQTVRRTTNWVPSSQASITKRFLARNWNNLVLVKNKLFGSGTLKNRR